MASYRQTDGIVYYGHVGTTTRTGWLGGWGDIPADDFHQVLYNPVQGKSTEVDALASFQRVVSAFLGTYTSGRRAQGDDIVASAPALEERQRHHLDDQGYLILDNVLPANDIAHYRQRLLALAAEEPGRVNPTQHIRWLVNKGADFRRMLLHPTLDPWFRYLLGEDYALSTLTSNVVRPGAPDGRYHADFLDRVPEPWPEYALTANSLWLLDDFTPENGGTRLVPGSHRWRRKPPKDLASHPEEVRIGAPAGSVLLFNGAVWHSSGANQTDRERVCLICFCLRSFMKPQFDFVGYLGDEAYAEASPELKRLYGFTAWPQPVDGPGIPTRRQ